MTSKLEDRPSASLVWPKEPRTAPPERLALLRSIPLFEGLREDDIQALAGHVEERTFSAGQAVFNRDEPGSTMYIVASGQVNIYLPGDASRRISLNDVGRGEYFGDLALFDDKPRSASAQATTDVVLLELARDTLRTYLDKRPRAALAILRTMSERLRETNALLSERAARNVVRELEEHLSFRDRLADKVAEMNGSWSFIALLCALVVAWTVINSPGLFGRPFDPYPYVFFNLLLAILVSLQGPLIVMSQNRQMTKDRAQAEADFNVNLKNEVHIETILRELGEFREETSRKLEEIERAGREP